MNKSDNYGFYLPSRDADDIADINQISENFRIIDKDVPSKEDLKKLGSNVDNKQDKFADVTERDGAVILTSTVSDDRPPQAILKNGVLELGAMHLQFGDGQGEVSLKGLNAPDDSLNINANDNRIRNVADPIFDKDAVNKKYFERNLPSVDQTYTPESEKAQSGIAVAEAVSGKADKWTTLIDTTLTKEQGGVSELWIEIPNNGEIFKTISRMKLLIDIKAPEVITAQRVQIGLMNYGEAWYNVIFCYNQSTAACNAGETLYFRGAYDFYRLNKDSNNREYFGVLAIPAPYISANSISTASKVYSNFYFTHWGTRPPYLYIKLASGGIIGAGSKIVMEVC
jgi:hypothetical protein